MNKQEFEKQTNSVLKETQPIQEQCQKEEPQNQVNRSIMLWYCVYTCMLDEFVPAQLMLQVCQAAGHANKNKRPASKRRLWKGKLCS